MLLGLAVHFKSFVDSISAANRLLFARLISVINLGHTLRHEVLKSSVALESSWSLVKTASAEGADHGDVVLVQGLIIRPLLIMVEESWIVCIVMRSGLPATWTGVLA